MPLTPVVIAAARRTPIGSLNGALALLAAHELGAIAIRAALNDAGIDAADVDEAILGQVLTAGQGMNPARQASRRADCRMRLRLRSSTRSAARGCGPLRWGRSRFRPGRLRLSSRAGRRA